MKTFVANLAVAIKDSGLSKRAFAERAGISHGALNNYLLGRPPKLEEATKLATFLGKTLDELLTGDATPPGEAAAVWKARALAAEDKLHGLKAAMGAWLKKI